MKIEEHRVDHCPHCGGHREAHVNRKSGRGVVTIRAACPHKAKCEGEIMAGFDWRPDMSVAQAVAEADGKPAK